MQDNLLENLINETEQQLSEFAQSDEFTSVLATSFETEDAEKIANLQQVLSTGAFFDPIEIETLPGSELGALGAYASENSTIYLDQDLLASSPDLVSSVLLEETGHAIDDFLNETDASGDEGAMFASLVQGEELSNQELASLRQEDDSATLNIDNESVAVEQAELTVTTNSDFLVDDNELTLREAIQQANENSAEDTITFDSSLAGSTIELLNGSLNITSNLTIQGLGENELTVDAAGNSRVFLIDDGNDENLINASISAMTLSGGVASNSVGSDIFNDSGGGGIFNRENLTLANSTVSGNFADLRGGGIFSGYDSNLKLLNSTVSGNSANDGGGIFSSEGNTTTIIDSAILSNSTTDDSDDLGSIVQDDNSTVTLISSTVSNNSGGGISNAFFDSSTTTILNTTISGNSANGIFNGRESTTTVINSTISGNSGNGIDNGENDRTLTLSNNIIANNSYYDLVTNGNEEITGPNLIENTTLSGGAIINQDPNLSSLENNGGSTLTQIPQGDSPAIDAGINAAIPADTFDLDGDGDTEEQIPFDQRGEGFDRVVNGTVDLGAVEVQDGGAEESSIEHGTLEKISRNFIYPSEGQAYSEGETFKINDTEFKIDQVIENNQGLFALGLTPTSNSESAAPVLAFRGTEISISQPSDLFSDLNEQGIGLDQFLASQNQIQTWLSEHNNTYVTGHSLGAALAQWSTFSFAAQNENGNLGEIVTFNSPGIDNAGIQQISNSDSVLEFNSSVVDDVTHYVGDGDLVSLAGSNYLPGNWNLGSFNSPPVTTVPSIGDYLFDKHVTTHLISNERPDEIEPWPPNFQPTQQLSSSSFSYLPDTEYSVFRLAIGKAINQFVNPTDEDPTLGGKIAELLETRASVETLRQDFESILAQALLQEFTNETVQALEEAHNTFEQLSQQAKQEIVDYGIEGTKALVQWSAENWQTAQDWVSDAWTAAQDWGEDAWSATTDWTSEQLEKTKNWTEEQWNEGFVAIQNSITSLLVSPVSSLTATASSENLTGFNSSITAAASSNSLAEPTQMIDIPINLSASNNQSIEVDYQTSDGTAEAGEDYVATNGTLSFDANETQKTISVEVSTADLTEDGKTFNINFSNPTNVNLVAESTEVTFAKNLSPTVAEPISDQTVTVGEGFTLTTATAFQDPNEGDALTFSAQLSNGDSLPDWITFDASSGTLVGTPSSEVDEGTINIQITAADSVGETVSETFELNINDEGDQPDNGGTSPNIVTILQQESPEVIPVSTGFFVDYAGTQDSTRTFNIQTGAGAQNLDAGATVNLTGTSSEFDYLRDGSTFQIIDDEGNLTAELLASPDTASSVSFDDGNTEVAVAEGQITFGGLNFEDGEQIDGAMTDLMLEGAETTNAV